MAYVPKTWVDDEIVYEADMNHIEEGIAEASGGVETLDTSLGKVSASLSEVKESLSETKESVEDLKEKVDGMTLDTTLSIEGKAADAKAVGDALANVNLKVSNKYLWGTYYYGGEFTEDSVTAESLGFSEDDTILGVVGFDLVDTSGDALVKYLYYESGKFYLKFGRFLADAGSSRSAVSLHGYILYIPAN